MFVMRTKGRERYAGQGAAKDKFVAIVKELVQAPKLADLQENERGYSYLLHPNAK
jgi:hypothetical protein